MPRPSIVHAGDIRLVILTAFLSLTACGGSGGGGNDGSLGSAVLGTRSDQGITIQVTRLAESTSSTIQARVQLTTYAGESAPTSVLCWIGSGYDADAAAVATEAKPVAGQAGVFDIALPLPSSQPFGTSFWMRLVYADGTEIELGRDAFPL